MKRPAKAKPKTRAVRKRVAPAPAPADPAPAEPADEPDRPGIEAAEQVGPNDDPRSTQTDIEHADERRLGSVESVPDQTQGDAVVGFIEPQ